jgi:hypothetical protein
MLKYCQHRGVSEDGKVICRKITRGDQEVSLAICEACPAAECNCGHLRFSLEKEGDCAVIIRYGNGRSEVLEGGPSGVRFTKSACAAQMRTIDTHRDCVGCPLRSNGFVRNVIPPAQIELLPARAKIIRFPSPAAGRA